MADELGSGGSAVHREAEAVIRFWLHDTPADKRFARDAALDTLISERFGALRQAVLRDPGPWRLDERTALAAVILLDQFSRNLFRGDARAFDGDATAISIAEHAIERGWDTAMTGDERQFLYMPFMHSEDPAQQQRSVTLFASLNNELSLEFARRHQDQIRRFGRFPGRNDALGRTTTNEEADLLTDPAQRF